MIKKKGQDTYLQDFQKNKGVYLMALPVLVYYIVFHYLPMAGLVIAFQDYNLFRGFRGSKWVGLENFIRFLTGPNIVRLIRNTFLINFYDIVFGFPAPVILALMINEFQLRKIKKVVQTISYMPHFISLVVICGMINDFSRVKGLFNGLRSIFGLPAVNLLSDPALFRPIFVSSSIWQGVGWGSIIYLATLSTVDPNLYEAAEIDGAGRFRRILHISLPVLVPIITVQFIMRLGHILSLGFEKVMLLYNPLTYETADVISTYLYRYGLQQANYSFGTAAGLINSLIQIMVLVTVNGLFRHFTDESLW
jgi:putative aldouronate transport system permease protein